MLMQQYCHTDFAAAAAVPATSTSAESSPDAPNSTRNLLQLFIIHYVNVILATRGLETYFVHISRRFATKTAGVNPIAYVRNW